MYMKSLIIFTLFIIIPNFGYGDTFLLNTKKSIINWRGGKHIGEHRGTVKFKFGSIESLGNVLKHGIIVVSLESILVKDLVGEWATKIKLHLKNKDFFDVTNYPISTLTFDTLQKDKDQNYHGKLRIKNIEKEVKFRGEITRDKNTIKFSGDLIFDRTKFKITYNSGNFFKNLGDKLIKDKVNLKLNLIFEHN